DDYLRKTENADHAEWEDVLVNNKKVTIVRRIRSKIIEVLRNEFEENIERKQTSKASALGRKLGGRLLPPTNFGKRPTPGVENKKLSRKDERKLSVDLIVKINPKKSGTVAINVNMGSNHYNAQKSSTEMGEESVYPFKIVELKVLNVNNEETNIEYEALNDDRYSIILSSFNKLSSFEVLNSTEETLLNIEISLILEINDPLIQPYIQAKEVK